MKKQTIDEILDEFERKFPITEFTTDRAYRLNREFLKQSLDQQREEIVEMIEKRNKIWKKSMLFQEKVDELNFIINKLNNK